MNDFFCVGVMYSGEYVCDVTLSVYSHRTGLKNMPVTPPKIRIILIGRANHLDWQGNQRF